jgi:beta-galactosidase GanA
LKVRILSIVLASLMAFVNFFALLPVSTEAAAAEIVPNVPEVSVTSGQPHTVSWDKYSLKLDDQRVPIWSAEFHYWRLPSQQMWLEILQKIKASGYNAVSIYFDWGFHSPKQGVYDFTGLRDIDALLNMTQQAGLYVIARPGPYINAETDSGGFPGWLHNTSGEARTSAADYTAAYQEWLSAVDPILARHQINNGGNIILYQTENEYFGNDPQYMQDVIDKAKADGITVPTFHNDAGLWSNWASGKGAPDIYSFDAYPQGFDCSNPTGWGAVPTGIESGVHTASPNSPIFLAEFQGGAFDKWGSSGYGFGKCREKTGPDFINVFYKGILSQGATLMNSYMGYGGTNWGWLPSTTMYTSYDYGAPIDEALQLTPKAYAMKRIGYMLHAVNPFAKTVRIDNVTASNMDILVNARKNPDNGTTFWTLQHASSGSSVNDTTKLTINGQDGTFTIPQKANTSIRINGRDAKTLISGYSFGVQRLIYSTSELLTNTTITNQDVAVLYGRNGEDGETMLRFANQPTVEVLSGNVSQTYNKSTGQLRLNYTHTGLAKIKITGGGNARDLILWIGTDEEADRVWLNQTENGPVLVRGPYLVRSASTSNGTLALTGDTEADTGIEILAGGVGSITWNGGTLPLTVLQDGSSLSQLSGPPAVQLPALTGWKFMPEAPEKLQNFDDSNWTNANASNLQMDTYGFHYGYVWYRGHFTATGQETGISLSAKPGNAGRYNVWINGTFVGGSNTDKAFTFPAGALKTGQDNVISVLIVNMSHDEDWAANESWRDPRGVISATMSGATTAIAWKIQGAQGGENVVDTTRGIFNVSGLYGERNGWYLPNFDTSAWSNVTLPHDWSAASVSGEGVGWYKTRFTLSIPDTVDVPLGIHFDKLGTKLFKAQLFINGWNMGLYYNNVGPQNTFFVPKGILNTNGINDISIAVWGEGTTDGGLGNVTLAPYGTFSKASGGVAAQGEWNSISVDDSVLGTNLNQLNYVGAWGRNSGNGSILYNRTNSWSNTTGNTVSMNFNGTGVKVYAVKDNNNGIGAVSIDGGPETMVDLYTPIRDGNQLVYSKLGLTNGQHTVTIRVTGAKNPNSIGNYFVLDRIEAIMPADPVSDQTIIETPILGLRINGSNFTSFDPLNSSYDVNLLRGSALPIVEAVKENDSVQVQIEQVSSLPGKAVITATSGDGLTTHTYEVNFNEVDQYLSDLNWTSATTGYSTIKKDLSLDGNPIKVLGASGVVTYEKGIGTHANSEIVYDLPEGMYQRFTAVAGVDQEISGSSASVRFQVWLDGVKSFDTGTTAMRKSTVAVPIDIDVTGVRQLKLVVTDAGNGIGEDHGDWANAKLIPIVISSDAALSSLKVNGANVNSFDPSTLSYDVQLPTGSTIVPDVTYVTNDPNATAVVLAATSLPGTTSVEVTAANGTKKTYVIHFSIAVSSVPQSTLAGTTELNAGETFNLTMGLSNVTQSVYAQDIKMDYDPNVFEFVSAVSLKDGISLVETRKDTPGKLRFILASEGAGKGVTGNAGILELKFKAKAVTQPATGTIAVTDATLGDAQGVELKAQASTINVSIATLPPGIPGDVNHDNRVSIGDLGIIAKNYGKTSSSPDWEQVKQADVTGDHKIDIDDLALVARKIME